MCSGHNQDSSHITPLLVYISCAGDKSSTERKRQTAYCRSRIAVRPGGVRSHLQEVTEYIKNKEKEQERQLVTSSSKCFGMSPAMLQRWPHICQVLSSYFSQLLWDHSPATLPFSPCLGQTLCSWKSHELQWHREAPELIGSDGKG